MLIRTTSDVGAVVRRVRRERGWTQAQLAARVGVARSWIIRLEGGAGGVELALVLRTFAALDQVADLSSTAGPRPTPQPSDEPLNIVDLNAVLADLTPEHDPPGGPVARPRRAPSGAAPRASRRTTPRR